MTSALTSTLADWERWVAEGHNRLPVRVLRHDQRPPPSWEGFSAAPVSVLLESGGGAGGKEGDGVGEGSREGDRLTCLCDRPERVVVGDAEGALVQSPDSGAPERRLAGTPTEVLTSLMDGVRAPPLPGWPSLATGGWLGVFGYDLVWTWERLPRRAHRDAGLPLYAFVEARELFVLDAQAGTLGVVVWRSLSERDGRPGDLARLHASANAAALAALGRWDEACALADPLAAADLGSPRPEAAPPESLSVPPPSFTPEAFHGAVRAAQGYIAAGHTYQVNLSVRRSRATAADPGAVYEALRRLNPSPYMGLLRLPAFTLVCGSPELLVKLDHGVLSSRPIAGTRPRGSAPGQDDRLSAELLASEKERAEHLMLVDLIRNDLGRVAAPGTVRVPEFMALERYSHVMHIVSQVEGLLAPGKTWADVLRSFFPGGTITGCPKIRTLEIIEELEPVGRGLYTGALGWIGYRGDLALNIIIRSMLVKDGLAHVQAGAGIVADSVPEREYDEAMRKARALWVALDRAEEGPSDA